LRSRSSSRRPSVPCRRLSSRPSAKWTMLQHWHAQQRSSISAVQRRFLGVRGVQHGGMRATLSWSQGVYVPRSVDWHPALWCIISRIMRNNDGNQVAPLTREHPRRRYTPVDTPWRDTPVSKGMQVVMQTGARPHTAGNRPSNCLHASALCGRRASYHLPRIKYSRRGPFPDSSTRRVSVLAPPVFFNRITVNTPIFESVSAIHVHALILYRGVGPARRVCPHSQQKHSH
jgi:hypothetical protein